MFRSLIEAIRNESAQSGSVPSKKVGPRGIFNKGPMTWHSGKQAEKKRTNKERRQQDKKAAMSLLVDK